MIHRIALSVLLLIIITLFACKKIYEESSSDVVINEIMPVNSTIVADNYGEYDDWIELFNLSGTAIDLSGYYLSDNKKKPGKWTFPQGTIIAGNDYLIIWADEDTTELGLHANFKFSSGGEDAVLSSPDKTILDKVSFPAQSEEFSYARVPNGTGDFKWQTPTFDRANSAGN